MAVAVGIKREGIDFDSLDGEKSRIFILVVSPRKTSGPHIQFLAAIGAVLNNEEVRRELISTDSKDRAAALLRSGPGKR
jgi:mannitol/fructose-specific phosphotransferase system IIA component (Ntr-type)